MKEYLVWFSKLQISNSVKKKLLKKFGNLETLYHSSLDDLVDMNINDNLISKILNLNLREQSKSDFQYMSKNNIDIIGIEDKLYPQKFKLISDSPIAIYVRGNPKILDEPAVAIIGSRNAYQTSLNATKEISKIISQNNINIVSGLARGVDKYAHLGCLENRTGGKAIAVLGNGIDDESIYPYENKRVFERILQNGGAIISEYPIKTKPLPYNFPYRNRLISALSEKVIVMQASLKSGSLITVDYALDQGKDIYVYKDDNINAPAFSGNRLLLENTYC